MRRESGVADSPLFSTFALTSEPEQLVRMRSWLWTVLVGQGLPLEECAKLLLAAGELCNNAIVHAYGGAAGRPIRVSLELRADRVAVEVEDWGAAYDPSRYQGPDLDALPDCGLGLFLVRSAVDEVAFDVDRVAGTRWTLTKRWGPGGSAGGVR
jgi:serine/threonine-protein kinase RsbW